VTVRKEPRSSHHRSVDRNGQETYRLAVQALQLGFVAFVVGGAVLLVMLGYPAAAVVEVVVGAGLAAVEMIRRLGSAGAGTPPDHR